MSTRIAQAPKGTSQLGLIKYSATECGGCSTKGRNCESEKVVVSWNNPSKQKLRSADWILGKDAGG